jgi:hypothetical protein
MKTARVTRLGAFSAYWAICLLWAATLKVIEATQIFGYLFHGKSYVCAYQF